MLYDLSFVIWVGVMLFNIITGLMLDAFAEVREEANNHTSIYPLSQHSNPSVTPTNPNSRLKPP